MKPDFYSLQPEEQFNQRMRKLNFYSTAYAEQNKAKPSNTLNRR